MLIESLKRHFFSSPVQPSDNKGETCVYFHDFRSQEHPKEFGVMSFAGGNFSVSDVFSKIKKALNISANTPMQAYAVKDAAKLRYSWLYDLERDGYGPKRNFTPLAESELLSRHNHILVNYHHSQHNEDYIIQNIFDRIGTSSGYFVEFGAGDGQTISNTVLLRYAGWKGLLIEPGGWFNKNIPGIACRSDFLTPENIESVFDDARVPTSLDLLSIDIDGNDYYLWQALNRYQPRLLVIEVDGYSHAIHKLESFEAPGNGPKSSLIAMTQLCEKKGYSLVYNNLGNAFYIRKHDYENHFRPIKGVAWNEPFTATCDLFS
jgi:hypothetical protein